MLQITWVQNLRNRKYRNLVQTEIQELKLHCGISKANVLMYAATAATHYRPRADRTR